jgi:hypothetical protein
MGVHVINFLLFKVRSARIINIIGCAGGCLNCKNHSRHQQSIRVRGISIPVIQVKIHIVSCAVACVVAISNLSVILEGIYAISVPLLLLSALFEKVHLSFTPLCFCGLRNNQHRL